MRPTAAEVLRAAIWSYDTYIQPEVREPFARSLSLTVGNLLRHVLARLEHEGQLLFEDNRELTGVLLGVREFVERLDPAGTTPELSVLSGAIDDALHKEFWRADDYPALHLVVERACSLRAVLDDAIRALQAARDTLGARDDYRALRERIRSYLRHQLERQATWDTEALVGERR
jgi:hypothetical protein